MRNSRYTVRVTNDNGETLIQTFSSASAAWDFYGAFSAEIRDRWNAGAGVCCSVSIPEPESHKVYGPKDLGSAVSDARTWIGRNV